MTAVLGISAHYHDAAAALVVDGEIVAAVGEERLSRIKNDSSLPLRAARSCLDLADLSIGAVDRVVYYENPFAKLERLLLGLLKTFPASWRQFPRALGAQVGSKLWVLDHISESLGVARKRVEFVSHHESHAASAYLCSPYQDAAILVVDAVGEASSTSIWTGQGGAMRRLMSIDYPHSLGLFYGALTAYLGFAINEGEYKVMGLAAYGTPRFEREFAKLLVGHSDGSYELGLPYFGSHAGAELAFAPMLEKLLGPRRPPHRPWNLASEEDRRFADIAATTQKVTEDVMVALARRAHAEVGGDALCLAGGVALNCVANARILAETPFSRIFVQPAAGDAGGALGAALLGAQRLGAPRASALESAALGVDIRAARACELAAALGLRARRVDSPADAVATALVSGKLVAVASGRCEWGPRALGQRSILALPTSRDTRTRINRVVKEREDFRPFAPAVLESASTNYFDVAPNDMTRFMTTVSGVRPECREALSAVLHVDGTSRVQTVRNSSAPLLHDILQSLEVQTDMPIVLNTSLNGRGEPIVGSESDALGFFTRHPVDALLVGDLFIERSQT